MNANRAGKLNALTLVKLLVIVMISASTHSVGFLMKLQIRLFELWSAADHLDTHLIIGATS
jgi:hypothetical protein